MRHFWIISGSNTLLWNRLPRMCAARKKMCCFFFFFCPQQNKTSPLADSVIIHISKSFPTDREIQLKNASTIEGCAAKFLTLCSRPASCWHSVTRAKQHISVQEKQIKKPLEFTHFILFGRASSFFFLQAIFVCLSNHTTSP